MKKCTPREFGITDKEYALALGSGAAVITLAAWLFYDSPLGILPGIPFLYFYMKSMASDFRQRREEQDERKFRDGIQAVSAALAAGASAEHAFADGHKELAVLYGEDDGMTRNFAMIVRKSRSGVPLEQALREFARDSGSDSVRDFAEVFDCAKRLGGSLVSIIGGTVHLLSDQQEVRQEIATVISGRKFEQRIMTVMPFFLILYLKLTMPGFLDPLYGNTGGVLVMSGALAMLAGSWFLGRKISDIHV